jgi:hypothetical protein
MRKSILSIFVSFTVFMCLSKDLKRILEPENENVSNLHEQEISSLCRSPNVAEIQEAKFGLVYG